MNGQIEWSALPLLAESHGVDDLQELIGLLVVIREGLKRGSQQNTN